MLRVAVLSALVMLFALPLSATGQVLTVQTAGDGPLLRSGIAAVERRSDVSRRDSALAAQAQQSHLNHDKKTVIIVVAVAALAAVIWINHELRKGIL